MRKLIPVSEESHSFEVCLQQIKADGTPVIDETWKITTIPDARFRIFDISIHQVPAAGAKGPRAPARLPLRRFYIPRTFDLE